MPIFYGMIIPLLRCPFRALFSCSVGGAYMHLTDHVRPSVHVAERRAFAAVGTC